MKDLLKIRSVKLRNSLNTEISVPGALVRTIEKCWPREAKDRPAIGAVFSSIEMAAGPEITAMVSDTGSDIRGAAEVPTEAAGSGRGLLGPCSAPA